MTVYRPASHDPGMSLDAFSEWENYVRGPGRTPTEIIPRVAFPIINVWRDDPLPVVLHIGHPLTDARHVYPLRKKQRVYLRPPLPGCVPLRVEDCPVGTVPLVSGIIEGGIIEGVIETVGEHTITFGDITWYSEPLPFAIPQAAGAVRVGEMLRLEMLVVPSAPAFP